MFTSEKLKMFMFKLTPVTSKIGQGHPSSNLTKVHQLEIHPWYKFGPQDFFINIVLSYQLFTKRNN